MYERVYIFIWVESFYYVYPQQWDQKDYFGAKGKCPWISINGTHVDDSEFIIQYLGELVENLNFGAE